jgi:hypothetical protein
MAKPKSKAEKYEVALAAAREAGGDSKQSHWLDRLKAVMKRRSKTAKKSKSQK